MLLLICRHIRTVRRTRTPAFRHSCCAHSLQHALRCTVRARLLEDEFLVYANEASQLHLTLHCSFLWRMRIATQFSLS